jgi:hypothetical protein
MQRAWFDYALDLVKLAAFGALAPWIFWVIWGVATAALPVAWRATKLTARGGRFVLGKGAGLVRGLPEYLESKGLTSDALTKMRYFTRERQLANWLENTRTGQWFSNLSAIKNSRIARGGTTALKYGTTALIPAIAAYETYSTYQRTKGAEGNPALQAEYKSGYSNTALETGGLVTTMPLSFGPQIVLAAPVLWAASYDRSRSEVRAGWARRPLD